MYKRMVERWIGMTYSNHLLLAVTSCCSLWNLTGQLDYYSRLRHIGVSHSIRTRLISCSGPWDSIVTRMYSGHLGTFGRFLSVNCHRPWYVDLHYRHTTLYYLIIPLRLWRGANGTEPVAAWWYHPISKAISCHIDSVIWASRELSALFARFPENTVLAIGLLCVWVEVPCPFKWVTEVNGD